MTTPQELAAEAIAAAQESGDRQALRERICEEHRLPVRLADRLVGEDAASLRADASDLAKELGIESLEVELLSASKAERNQQLIELAHPSERSS